MTETVRYRVKRAFTYGGHRYKQGDLWTPGGAKLDDSIIRNGLVSVERVKDAEEPQAGKRGAKVR